MTGFGKAEANLRKHKLTVEIRSLNSKQLDLNVKTPALYREKEAEIRSLAGQALGRGKVDVALYIDSTEGDSAFTLNQALAMKYFRELTELGQAIGKPLGNDALGLILRMPDVLRAEREQADEEEWEQVKETLSEALARVDRFRQEEARPLADDLAKRNLFILQGLERILPFEQDRLGSMKERLRRELNENVGEGRVDANRFEQEIIYYLEKLDITEERVRLEKHCAHFAETLNSPDSEGKKLGFIAQEMGREINTIGSKANDASIQRIVVEMKDELEKIKEQLGNIL